MHHKLFILIASIAIPTASYSQEVTQPENDWGEDEAAYNQRINAINSRYQQYYDSAREEGEDIADESETCMLELVFDADWEMTKVSFDVPEVKMKLREMKFDAPKTSFETKTISKTKIPKTYFETKKIGFGIKTKVPVIRWEIDEVKTKVPVFKWDTTSIKTKIPEFHSRRVEWKFHILKIKKLKEGSIPCDEEKNRAEELSQQTEARAAQHEKEIQLETATFLATQAGKLADQIVAAEAMFDEGIASMDKSIADLKANGSDPNAVLIDYDGQKVTMVQARQLLVEQKARALAEMAAAQAEMAARAETMTGTIA